jgi:hypothetical protein
VTPAPAPVPAPGGFHVGYYQEDPTTNPEDPTAGAFSVNLPAGNDAFSGSMYFTYVGCQTSNLGVVSGSKSNGTLSGMWSGTLDGSPQSGSYSGTYQAATQSYAGIFNNAGGKQFRDLRPCITYTIAPNGTFELFPVGATIPSSFTVQVSGRTISWSSATGGAGTLIYVINTNTALAGVGNPVLWQTIVGGATTSTITIPSNITLAAGAEHVAVVSVGNSASQRVAFGSRRFTP